MSYKILFLAIAAGLLGYFAGNLVARAEPVQIAVIDSGVNSVPQDMRLCATGHKDFTGTDLTDDLGHGTAITSIIASHLPNKGVCIVVLKVFSRKKLSPMLSILEALNYVSQVKKVKFVNLSLSGMKPHLQEEILIQRLLAEDKKVVAAAGNNGFNFTKMGCVTYPACYDPRIIVVGDLLRKFNHGRGVDIYEHGNKQYFGGMLIQGTSAAAAHATGKLASKLVQGR